MAIRHYVQWSNRSSNNLGELGRKKLRGERNPFARQKEMAERQTSENEHQNTRNLLNVDSSLNQSTLLCEQSRFCN
jgi:hypothetical protein